MKKITLLFSFIMVFTFAKALVYNVTVPVGTKACYIAGAMNGWTHQEMTKVDGTHYTIDITGATEEQKYKYCSGPNWGYVEKNADGDDIGDRSYTASDVVEKWGVVYDPGLTASDVVIKVKVPSTWKTPINLHFWGDTSSNWPGELMTQEGDWWTYTFTNVTNINIIMNDGTNQTGNIEGVSKSTCYEIAEDNGYAVVDCSSATSIEQNELSPLNISVENGKLTALLNGKNDVKLYSITGQLIIAKKVSGNFTYKLDKGIYILSLNNEAQKVLVK